MIFCTTLFFSYFLPAGSQILEYEPDREYKGQTIWQLPDIPEEKIDIGLWSLIIAKEFDPSIDVNHFLDQLEEKARKLKAFIRNPDSDKDVIIGTAIFLKDPGWWNDFTTFTYDLEDPLGEIFKNKLLSTYLTTKKGNCVSMPTLFISLVERINPKIPLFAVSAPSHMFCRLRDRQTGEVVNIGYFAAKRPGNSLKVGQAIR